MNKENKKECRGCGNTCGVAFEFSSDHLCKNCKVKVKKELEKCEEWETKKKQILNDYLNNQKEAWNISLVSGATYYSSCQKCGTFIEKINSFGDIEQLEHECRQSNQMSSDTNKTNYLPWVLGGTGLVGLIGVIVYFVVKNKKGEKE